MIKKLDGLNFLNNRHFAFLASNFLVTLMITCVAFGFVQLGQKIIPTWNGSHLIWFCFLISLEAIYSFHSSREREGRELLFYRISEVIFILIIVKLLIYSVHSFQLLIDELPFWKENFLLGFFTPEYLFSIFLVYTVWIFSHSFASEIDDLHNRQDDALWDEIGKVQNNLKAIRSRLIDQTFSLGGAVIVLAIFARADLSNIQQIRFDASIPIVNVIAYFIFGLLLLAQTQFALLQTRWLWEKIPITQGMSQIWLRYSIAFFIILGILVFFLPTNYTVGLLDVIRFVLTTIWQIIVGIIFFISLLFSFLLSLLLGTAEAQSPSVTPPSPTVIPPSSPESSIAWLEYLKSLFFWLALIGIVGYAVTNYIHQNSALLGSLRKIPFLNWMFNILSKIFTWISSVNSIFLKSLSSQVIATQIRARESFQRAFKRATSYWLLNPREQIVYFYLNVVENASRRGIPRKQFESPNVYREKLNASFPEIHQEIQSISDEFVEARYSNHPINSERAKISKSIWEIIIAHLRHPPKKIP